jgi:hypothetical protein
MEQLLEDIIKQIRPIIQDEFDRYNTTRHHSLFEFQSKAYGIPFSRLVNDWRILKQGKVVDDRCNGMSKNGKICKNKSRIHGFCYLHASQYKPPLPPMIESNVIFHNHTLPPLWKDDCPACKNKKPFRDLVDCFNNE